MMITGKVIGINSSDGILNLLVVTEQQEQYNIKTDFNKMLFVVGYVYIFEVAEVVGERISYRLQKLTQLEELSVDQQDHILRAFYGEAPLSLEESKNMIYRAVDAIQNKVIHDITERLINDHKDSFFVFPAASRMHHHYVGGLAYHTIGMLEMADAFLKNYNYLDKDYLYAGVMLHDIGKTKELTGVQNTEYTIDGQLLGHLVMGALEIQRVALELGYDQTEEVRTLEHMLISHHGQPQFGAAKRPMTPEAIALWYIDTIDSKFRVLGEQLEVTDSGSFTDTIGVLDKVKVYKK